MSSLPARDFNVDNLLNAVETTGASSAVSGATFNKFGFQVTSTGGTVSATLALQGSNDKTNWYSLATPLTLSAAGSQTVQVKNEKHLWVRANVTARTNGAITVILVRGN